MGTLAKPCFWMRGGGLPHELCRELAAVLGGLVLQGGDVVVDGGDLGLLAHPVEATAYRLECIGDRRDGDLVLAGGGHLPVEGLEHRIGPLG
jgi:hypothetical protein